MRVDFEIRGDLCILRLAGRFVTGSEVDFLRTRDQLKTSGCTRAIAVLKDVPYVDSTGIAYLVGLYTGLRNTGGCFVLASVNARIREVLEITRLREIIPIYEDEDAALAALTDAAARAAASL